MSGLVNQASSDQEVVYYQYSPTFGTSQLIPHFKIDQRFVSSRESGASLSITVRVTAFRVLVVLATSALQQTIEIGYSDLVEVHASNNVFSADYGVTIVDRSGLRIHLASTRPQVVALDLWNSICGALIELHGRQGRIRRAINEISRYNFSSLCVPDDYYQLRSDTLQALIGVGFSYPINSRPTINFKLLTEAADGWFRSRSSEENTFGSSTSSNNRQAPIFIQSKSAAGSSADCSDNGSTTMNLKRPSPLSGNSSRDIYVPALSMGGGPYTLMAWFVDHEAYVSQGQPLVRIWMEDKRGAVVLKANNSGIVNHSKKTGDDLKVGGIMGSIVLCEESTSASLQAISGTNSSLAPSVRSCTISDAIKQGTLQVASGSTLQFKPSLASEPAGFKPKETAEADLKYALANSQISFQSFCNDLEVITSNGIDDDVVSIASFNEALYCALVREMHRYSLAEITDNQSELAKKNAGLGAMVGSLLGLISGNIFAPFLGHSYGKNMSDRGKRVEEFLPDPNLLFYQDENSYLSWSRAQVVSPRLRRLILDRRVKSDGNVFFRILPAIVTADSVFPIQLFKLDSSKYFYRPLSAGIERHQANYDAIKVQRRYFHLRGEGVSSIGTEIVVPISGRDIEDHQTRVFRFTGTSLDYFYVDFKINPGSVF